MVVSVLAGIMTIFGSYIASQDPAAPFSPLTGYAIGLGFLAFAGFQWWARSRGM